MTTSPNKCPHCGAVRAPEPAKSGGPKWVCGTFWNDGGGKNSHGIADRCFENTCKDRQIQNLKAEVCEWQHAAQVLSEAAEDPPSKNCSCHINPPCHDCVEFSALREAKELVNTLP